LKQIKLQIQNLIWLVKIKNPAIIAGFFYDVLYLVSAHKQTKYIPEQQHKRSKQRQGRSDVLTCSEMVLNLIGVIKD